MINYIVSIQKDDERTNYKSFISLKNAKLFIKQQSHRLCDLHYWCNTYAVCNCATYTLTKVSERVLNEVTYGKSMIRL